MHNPCAEPQGFCRAAALGGAVVWVPAVALLRPGWAAAILLLAALVLLPLGLALVATPERKNRQSRLWNTALWLQFPAAVVFVAAFAIEPGLLAAVLALPWLAFTVLIALLGLAHLLAGGWKSIEELSIDAGLIYLAVGGTWAVISRYGARPLDFSEIIVLATAVHFHYAGFVLPIITSLAARALQHWLAAVAALGVIAGVPMVAIGITLSAFDIRIVEFGAACFLAAAGIIVGVLQFWLVGRVQPALGRTLLGISGASLIVGMVLSILYALSTYRGTDWLDIPFMLPYHGAVNALGFALAGLLAWNVSFRRSASERTDATALRWPG